MKTRISIALFAVLLTGGAAAEAKTVDRPNIIFVLYDDLDATRGGNLAGVQAELDKGVDVNAKGERDMTPLHEAWRKEIVELLIVEGADVNAKDDDGTPLHNAALMGKKEIVELLIANGADVNTKIEVGDYKGQTPLDWAILNDHTETADLLRKHGGKTGAELKAEGK